MAFGVPRFLYFPLFRALGSELCLAARKAVGVHLNYTDIGPAGAMVF
jgi:hypothetical protein